MTPLVLIQARMESTRLPGKILAPILGQPLLLHQLDRLAVAFPPGVLVVITTDTPANHEMAALVRRHGYHALVPKAAPDDVLGRYVAAADELGADTVVRVTGDCPVIDPAVVKRLVDLHEWESAAYTALGPQWADGLDVEVIETSALREASQATNDPTDREHVTPFLWRQPECFASALLPCPMDLSAHCWSVDTEAGLDLARALFAGLWPSLGVRFDWRDVYGWLASHPAYWKRATEGRRNEAFMAQRRAAGAKPGETWQEVRYGVAGAE